MSEDTFRAEVLVTNPLLASLTGSPVRCVRRWLGYLVWITMEPPASGVAGATSSSAPAWVS